MIAESLGEELTADSFSVIVTVLCLDKSRKLYYY